MKSLPLLLLAVALLAGSASAQTIHVTPTTCVNISTSCPNIPLETGDYLWIHPQSGANWVMPSENSGQVCSNQVYGFNNYTNPSPSDANSVIYQAAFTCPNTKTVAIVLKGYRFYYRGGGGRGGGGAGWRWAITSGAETWQ
jgi:hypothetical protein